LPADHALRDKQDSMQTVIVSGLIQTWTHFFVLCENTSDKNRQVDPDARNQVEEKSDRPRSSE
jgi:hypothetical protein